MLIYAERCTVGFTRALPSHHVLRAGGVLETIIQHPPAPKHRTQETSSELHHAGKRYREEGLPCRRGIVRGNVAEVYPHHDEGVDCQEQVGTSVELSLDHLHVLPMPGDHLLLTNHPTGHGQCRMPNKNSLDNRSLRFLYVEFFTSADMWRLLASPKSEMVLSTRGRQSRFIYGRQSPERFVPHCF